MKSVRCLSKSSCSSSSPSPFQCLRYRYFSSSSISSSSSSSSQPAHHDIPSFLNYAYNNNLSPTSTVFSGTLYEYTVLHALSTRLPPLLTLNRSGGRDDYGIDLFGLWSPLSHVHNNPSSRDSSSNNNGNNTIIDADELTQSQDSHLSSSADTTNNNGSNHTIKPITTIPLLVQCKAVATAGPHIIRELEGALTNRSSSTMGILVSTANCTPGIRRHIAISARALGFIKVTPLEYTIPKRAKNGEVIKLKSGGGLLQQFVWNAKASEMLRDFGVTARYVPQDVVEDENDGDGNGKEEEHEDQAQMEGEEKKEIRKKKRRRASNIALNQEIALTYKGSPLPIA